MDSQRFCSEIARLELKYLELRKEVHAAALACGCYQSPILEVVFNEKGRGVVAKRDIHKGEIICPYEGELLTRCEGLRRYQADENSCFLFFFRHQEKSWCIDASRENFTFGRLFNHSRVSPNLKPVARMIGRTPIIEFIAKKDIPRGDELLWNYGEVDRDVLSQNPWLRS